MEPDPPAQIVPPISNRPKLPLIIGGILILLILSGAAYYFFVLQKKPAQPSPVAEQADSIPALKEKSIGCPLSEDLCKLNDSVKESSFSATVQEGSSLFAALDGEMQATPISRSLPGGGDENLTLLTILNREKKLVAMYYFKGKPTDTKSVKEGEAVATLNGQPLMSLENKSLVFIVQGLDKTGVSQLEPLAASHFK